MATAHQWVILGTNTLMLSCRSLPRQSFGKLQSKLFPAYFALTSACCTLCLGTMLYGGQGPASARWGAEGHCQ